MSDWKECLFFFHAEYRYYFFRLTVRVAGRAAGLALAATLAGFLVALITRMCAPTNKTLGVLLFTAVFLTVTFLAVIILPVLALTPLIMLHGLALTLARGFLLAAIFLLCITHSFGT